MKNYAMIIDYKYCSGCHSCEIACRNEKELPLEEWGIKVTEYGPDKLGGVMTWNYIPALSRLCDMCEERIAEGKKPACAHHCLAKCMEAVPVDQISQAMAKYDHEVLCYLP